MGEIATIDERKFVFLKDIDGNEAPIFIGSIVSAILSGAVPGFEAINQSEVEAIDEALSCGEHHHRELLGLHLNCGSPPENWRAHSAITDKLRRIRDRFGLPKHHATPDHCPYLRHQIANSEAFGL